MRRFQKPASYLAVSFMILLFAESSAHAYIDPGSGSMVIQLLVAGVAGVAALGKVIWRRVKERLTSKN